MNRFNRDQFNFDGEYLESSEIRPSINNDCLYGLAKFCGENILDSLCKGIDIAHLRVSQVAGNNRSDRVFEVMKKELFENNKITLYGNGNRISGFIGIKTLIKKINFFLDNDIKGIYNTSEYNLSYKDLASTILVSISLKSCNSMELQFKKSLNESCFFIELTK